VNVHQVVDALGSEISVFFWLLWIIGPDPGRVAAHASAAHRQNRPGHRSDVCAILIIASNERSLDVSKSAQ
jgi:hypothetical protein